MKRSLPFLLGGMCIASILSCDIFKSEDPAEKGTNPDPDPQTIDSLTVPSNVRSVSQTDSTAVIAWDSVASATRYHLHVRYNGLASNGDSSHGEWFDSVTTPQCTLRGLCVNTVYRITLYASAGQTCSEHTEEPLEIHWYRYGSPDNVRATQPQAGATTVSWLPKQEKGVSGYRLYVMDHNGVKQDSLDVDSNTLSAEVSGLEANKAFKLSVATLTAHGPGAIDSTAPIDTSSSRFNDLRLPYAYVSTFPKPAPIAGSTLVGVNGGIYMMGETWNDSIQSITLDRIYPGALPIHEVIVSSFYLDAYETTNEQFVAFLNDDQSISRDGSYILYKNDTIANMYFWTHVDTVNLDSFVVATGKEKLPMTGLTWYAGASYCNWRSLKEGLEPCYSDSWECDFSRNGYRLPTEAEYEYAASGAFTGVKQRFPWGFEWKTTGAAVALDDFMPVGSYPAYNGFYDLTGNVFEYVNDWSDVAAVSYQEGTTPYYIHCQSQGVVIDPRGPQESQGLRHLMRGGSIELGHGGNLVYYRYINHCSTLSDYGFRVARSAL